MAIVLHLHFHKPGIILIILNGFGKVDDSHFQMFDPNLFENSSTPKFAVVNEIRSRKINSTELQQI
jgi:hypothetical protein